MYVCTIRFNVHNIFYIMYVAVRVNFSRRDYTVMETAGSVQIRIVIFGGTSNIPITLTATPSEQSPISALGKSCKSYDNT